MHYTDEDRYLAALGRIFCYKPAVAVTLLEQCGDPASLFDMPEQQSRELFGPYSPYREQLSSRLAEECGLALEHLASYGAYFLSARNKAYPALLKECPDYPLGLYIRSESPPEALFAARKYLAVVGTRDLSPYGRTWTPRLVEALAEGEEKPCIVSGLALGIDALAHRSALRSHLPTLAVMATGIDSIYPHQHRQLAEEIAHSENSGLISAYPLGSAPLASQFLSRNRIIAGLCQASLLVESKRKGGGMITARHAAAYGREVYALPGRLDDLRSEGCNILIRDCVAEAVLGGEDLRAKLDIRLRNPLRTASLAEYIWARLGGKLPPEALEKAVHIAQCIRDEAGVGLSELCTRTAYPYAQVAALVSYLESEGIISLDILQRCNMNIKNV